MLFSLTQLVFLLNAAWIASLCLVVAIRRFSWLRRLAQRVTLFIFAVPQL
jgi:hypothetical protein